MSLQHCLVPLLLFFYTVKTDLSAQNLSEEFHLTDTLIRNPMMIQISQDSVIAYADTLSDFEKGYERGRGTARKLHAIAGPNGYVLILRPWRYRPDDGTASGDFVHPDFDDSTWEIINSTLRDRDLPQSGWQGGGWFRLHLVVDSALWNQPLALNMMQTGASEVYLDGKRMYQFGKVGRTKTEEQGLNPIMRTPEIVIFTQRRHVITVRYSSFISLDKQEFMREHGFSLAIGRLKNINASLLRDAQIWNQIHNVIAAILLAFAFLHFLIFLFSGRVSAHLYFALFTIFAAAGVLLETSDDIANVNLAAFIERLAPPYLCFVGLIGMRLLYSLFYPKLPRQFWYFLAASVILALWFWLTESMFLMLFIMLLFIASIVETFRIVICAIIQKQRGAWIIGIGFAIFALSFITMVIATMVDAEYSARLADAFIPIIILGILLSISLYLSQDIANTNKNLSMQTKKSQELAAENTRKEVELQKAAELRNAYLALEVAHASLKATQAQLIQSEKMASLGQLTAGIAHEIQNPLNFVNNFSEVNKELVDEMQQELKAGKIDDAISISNNIKDNQEKINFHGKRADAIVKGMLLHSRTSAGIKEPTDINALAEEYLRLAYHGLRAKDSTFSATFHTDFDKDLPKLNVVPQDIGRVILNLITNAFFTVSEKKKLQPEGYIPTVTVITQKLGHNIEIQVKDNGMGIPEHIKDKIFQPFFTTKPTGQGTGLGLSLSYDIVKAHGGEIKVSSQQGLGTIFSIYL